MEWAETCSKPRIGEFGGGAFVVSKEGSHYMNTGTWACKKIREVQGNRDDGKDEEK